MSWTLRALLLVLCVSFCADAQTRTLALYAEPAQGLDGESSRIMRAELQRLLAPAGLEVVWKSLTKRKSDESFDFIAVSSFEGSCSADAAPVSTNNALGDTSISNGHILPFFHVDCPHLIRMLGSQVEPAVLGRALGRVIAHEIYHIVAQTTDHQDSGVAKAVFSLRDLTSSRFDLDAWSLSRMRPVRVARTSDATAEETGR
jgi:hypothetical protein